MTRTIEMVEVSTGVFQLNTVTWFGDVEIGREVLAQKYYNTFTAIVVASELLTEVQKVTPINHPLLSEYHVRETLVIPAGSPVYM